MWQLSLVNIKCICKRSIAKAVIIVYNFTVYKMNLNVRLIYYLDFDQLCSIDRKGGEIGYEKKKD